MSLENPSTRRRSTSAVQATRDPTAPKFSFTRALLGDELTCTSSADSATLRSEMDHYFARKKFDSNVQHDTGTFGGRADDEWNDNQSNDSSTHTFVVDESQENYSGLWSAQRLDVDLDSLENEDVRKSSSFDDVPSSGREVNSSEQFESDSLVNSDRSFGGEKRKLPRQSSLGKRPDELNLKRAYQPTPSVSEPRLSKSFNESSLSCDMDSDDQHQDDSHKRKAYRKKVENHYKKLVESKVMTPESEILNQSWSSLDTRSAGLGGTDSPSYKIGVNESDWQEIDHRRSLSVERSGSGLAMHPEQPDPGKPVSARKVESSDSTPEHKAKVKKRVRVRRHDSIIKYGSEPDLSSRPKNNPVPMDVCQSQESLPDFRFEDTDHDTSGYEISETEDMSPEKYHADFYQSEADYYKTLPRGASARRPRPEATNGVLSRSTPNLTAAKKYNAFSDQSSDFESGHNTYPWKYSPRSQKQLEVDQFYVNFVRRDPSESSERSSRLDPQTYQSYAAGILHSSRKSEQFLKLQQRYAMLERIAEIEEGTLASNEILGRRHINVIHPKLMRSIGLLTRDDSIVDYLLLSKYKLENLEELRELYADLQEAQDREEFFSDAGKVQESQWTPFDDLGLATKASNINDLYSIYELGGSNFNTKSHWKRHRKVKPDDFRRDLSYRKLKEKYKHLDEESRKQRMMADFWRMKFGKGRRGSNESTTSATSTLTQGSASYLQIMEHVAKKSRERPLYGYHIDECRNSYDQYIDRIKRTRSMPNVSESTSPRGGLTDTNKRDRVVGTATQRKTSTGRGGRNSPELLGKARSGTNGGLKPPSGRSSESGYDSVERDLHQISKEPAKALEELWDIIDGKNSLLTKKYKETLRAQREGRSEEITVAYGSFQKGPERKRSSSPRSSTDASRSGSTRLGFKKGSQEKDYPDGTPAGQSAPWRRAEVRGVVGADAAESDSMPENVKRHKALASKSSPTSASQGDPWRSEVRGVVGVEASGAKPDGAPDVARSLRDSTERRLAQGSEFDRYLGNDTVSLSQKRYENFKVNRWRKDSKPEPGAVSAALSRLSSLGEAEPERPRERSGGASVDASTRDRGPVHRVAGRRDMERDSRAKGMSKSYSFDAERGQNVGRNAGRYRSEYGLEAPGKSQMLTTARSRGRDYLDLSPPGRDRDRSSRRDRFEETDGKQLAATGMKPQEVNPAAFHSAKSRFESPWPEDEHFPRTAFSGQSTRTPLGRYEAKIRSRSESPSRARPKSADPSKSRAGYTYEPYQGGNLRSREYGTVAKSTPALDKVDLNAENSGLTLKYNPKTGTVSGPTERQSDSSKKKWGLQIPPGPNRPTGSVNVSHYERRPDGQSTPSQQSGMNNGQHKSTDRTEQHMRLEDSDRSHKSLEPVRLNLLTSPSSVLPSKTKFSHSSAQPPGPHSGSNYPTDLSKFNRTPRPFVSSQRSQDREYPHLSEFRDEIRREVTGKERSPPESEAQDTRPAKPPRLLGASDGRYGDGNKWAGGPNRPRAGDTDPGPEPGRLQKWSANNLAHTSSLGSSNDTLIIKGSDPDLSETGHRTFHSVRHMKDTLAKNLEKAKSEPDIVGVGEMGVDRPKGAKSEENMQESDRVMSFHEIRAKYEASLKMPDNTLSKSQVPRTVSGDLKEINNRYSKGEAFRNREWEREEPQTPNTPMGSSVPFVSYSQKQSQPPPVYAQRKPSPASTLDRKNYNRSPVVEQFQKLITDDDGVRERDHGAEYQSKRPNNLGVWDVARDMSPPPFEVNAKMMDNLSTIETEWQKEKNRNVYSREIVMLPDPQPRQSSPAPSSQLSQFSGAAAHPLRMPTSRSSPTLYNAHHYDTYDNSRQQNWSSSTQHYPHQQLVHDRQHHPPQHQYSQHQYPQSQQPYHTQAQHVRQHQFEEPEYSTVDRRQKQLRRQQQQQQQQQQQLHPHMQHPQQPQFAAREARISNTRQHEGAAAHPGPLSRGRSHGDLQRAESTATGGFPKSHSYGHLEPAQTQSRDTHRSAGAAGQYDYPAPGGGVSSSDYHWGRLPDDTTSTMPRPKSAMAGLVKYTDPQYHVYTAQSRQLHPSGEPSHRRPFPGHFYFYGASKLCSVSSALVILSLHCFCASGVYELLSACFA